MNRNGSRLKMGKNALKEEGGKLELEKKDPFLAKEKESHYFIEGNFGSKNIRDTCTMITWIDSKGKRKKKRASLGWLKCTFGERNVKNSLNALSIG